MQNALLRSTTEERLMAYASYVGKLLFVCFIYFFSGNLGLSLGSINGFATLIWMPTGFALAALLLGGYRMWPAIFFSAFFLNATHGASLSPALGIALGNTLEAVIATYILIRFVHFRNAIDRASDILGLIFLAAPTGAFISATIGTLSLLFSHTIHTSSVSLTWTYWILGDFLSASLFAPFLLIWYTFHSFKKLSPSRLIEGIVVITFITICGLIILFTQSLTYIIFPPLIMLALRFDQRTVITTIILLTSFATAATAHEFGPFVMERLQNSLLYLQTFTGVVGITTFILAVITNEKKQLEQRKDEFISIASHELKIPITSMSIFLQLLQKHNQEREDEQSVDLINKTTKQMRKITNLIGDLLDISKMQIGKFELKKEKIIIDDLIHDVVDNMRDIITTHKIVIEGKSKKKVYVDRERINQVLTNLLNNAAKYSPNASKIRVKIRVTRQVALIQVTDFGIGIAKRDQQKIFERFFRVEGSDEKIYPGFGIGLYITEKIIRLHNGILWVESIKNQGSTFSFSLPLTKKTH